jgi:hypothetical protein
MRSEAEIENEILKIHELFQEWYRGSLPDTDLDLKIGTRLTENFQITFPEGMAHTKSDLLNMMRPDRGNDPRYKIVISDIDMLGVTNDVYRVNYIESQYWYGSESPNIVIQTSSTLEDSVDGLHWTSIYETKVD